jgi:hypothetical protein
MDVTVEFTGGCTDARTAAPTTGVLSYYYGARSYYYGAPYYYGIPTMLLLWAVVLMVRWLLSIDRHEGGVCASQNGRTEGDTLLRYDG